MGRRMGPYGWYMPEDKPPPKKDEPIPDVEDAPADKTVAWLLYAFHAKLGFEIYEAMQLADAKADWHKVESALAAGATREQVLRIFS